MQRSLQEEGKGWGGWSSWGKSLLSSATSTVGTSLALCSISRLVFPHPSISMSLSLPMCTCSPLSVSVYLVYVRTGQSLSSVKVKAGEALRLHATSVGEEAREEEEISEETREAGESEEVELSAESPSASAAAANRGVFSTISSAVQNTVSFLFSFVLILNFPGKNGIPFCALYFILLLSQPLCLRLSLLLKG